MAKIGRNDPCPYGSGKYKESGGNIAPFPVANKKRTAVDHGIKCGIPA